MKRESVILLLSLLLLSCGNKSKQGFPSSDVEDGWGEKYQMEMDDTVKTVKAEGSENEKQANGRSSSTGIGSYSSSRDDDYDNMRGFDPASEDDMDDNGMSRYIENNDEEGWY